MKIFAMSDIHGYLSEFEEALSKIDLSGENKLILLGDYVHGPDSFGVLDKIIHLQNIYGDKIIALLGNHEEMVLNGYASISSSHYGEYEYVDSDKYLDWMSRLPLYHIEGNAIFVHAGIDEDAATDGFWEWGTSEEIFTSKFPAETGTIEKFDMKIVAGHNGTCGISGDPNYHDIYFDGGSHYFIDGTIQESGEIPVLMYDTDREKYYRVTDSGAWLILPYDEEN